MIKKSNEDLTKYVNAYKRTLDNETFYTGIYTFIFIVTVVIYGLFGAVPLGKIVHQKIQTIQNLQNLNASLLKKRQSLSQLELSVLEAKKYTLGLETAVERDIYVERFVVSFVESISKAGYRQRSMRVLDEIENGVILKFRLQGTPSRLLYLVEAIESMNRLAVIEELDFMVKEGDAQVDIKLTIYYFKK